MQKGYQLSAGAIIYAVLRLEKQRFIGVENVLEDVTETNFSTFMQNAETELMEAGCAAMNFDGGLDLDADFSMLIARCADSEVVLSVSKRLAKKQDRLVIYIAEDYPSLRQSGEKYILASGKETVQQVLEFLQLPAQESSLPEILLDSALIEEQDAQGLKDAGCSDAMISLILNAIQGDGGYAVLGRANAEGSLDEFVLIYGPEGVFAVDVEYTQSQELFRFSPVDAAWVSRRIQALAQM